MSEDRGRPSVESLVGALDAEQIARGLDLRPDLLEPRPPVDIRDLTRRATTTSSVAQAVARCDRWCRQLVEVGLVLRGPTSGPAIAALIRTGSGDPVTAEQVRRGVERLVDRMLFFVDDGGALWLNPGLVALIPRPCGLGPPAADLFAGVAAPELRRMADTIGASSAGRTRGDAAAALSQALADRDTVARLLAEAPRDSVTLLRQARTGYVSLPYAGWRRPGGASHTNPYGWLLDRGLLVERVAGYGYGQAEVPREVAIALRGGIAVNAGEPDPPPLVTVRAGEPGELDRRAAARAGATVRSVTRLLGVLGEAPAMPLRDGGIGAREAGRLAKALDLTLADAFVVLEVAAAAGLVSPSTRQPVVPSTAADAWLDAPPADRWLHLAQAWLDAPGIPSIAGRKAPNDKVIPGLVTVNGIDGRTLRRATLDLLASALPGERVAGDLTGAVGWVRPAALQGLDEIAADLVDWTVAEASAVGLAVDATLTSLGRLLVAGDRAGAAQHTSSLLVDAPAEVILQADLTAVVDAAAPQQLLDELRLLADAESAGSALVLRFSSGSIRRGLDAGRDAEQILAFLAAHATRGVPQPLEYLVSDTARRWGSVRVGTVASYVRADDPVLLEEAIRHRRLAKSGLRLLAPTVAVSQLEAAQLLSALRDAGFLPVEEDATGVTLRTVPRRERSAAPVRSQARSTSRSTDPATLRSVAEAVLAAGDASAASASPSGRGPVRAEPEWPRGEMADWSAAEEELDDDLDDEIDADEVFGLLADLLGTATVVELRIDDPVTGWERAVTGLVDDIDPGTGRVTVRREPDGAMVEVDPEDVFGIRVLRREAGRR